MGHCCSAGLRADLIDVRGDCICAHRLARGALETHGERGNRNCSEQLGARNSKQRVEASGKQQGTVGTAAAVAAAR